MLEPGQVFRDCSDCPVVVCPVMVVVPAGEFVMGSTDFVHSQPPHKVTIQRPFAVGKFEVTFAEWDAGDCNGYRPNDQGWGRGRRPVINVSWHDAKEYAEWLSRKTGKMYRLLSEAEWEYAARAGTATSYAFGDTITPSQAQYSPAGKTAEVGSFPANSFGLHDLHGNVSEWVEDPWHPSYQGTPDDGSVWLGGDTSERVSRGGSWVSLAGGLRPAIRGRSAPGTRTVTRGFRLARTI
jgi:formylglycine-generating enzyme required for sulfatase activity